MNVNEGSDYCKFGHFRENVIFAYSVKRHINPARNSRLGHDLPTSANDKLMFDILREFYIHETLHMRSSAKIKPSTKFPN